MKKITFKNVIDFFFCLIILLYILLSLYKSYFKPNIIIVQENRYANLYKKITFDSFENGKTQENIEDVLSDQIVFASRMRGFNNYIKGLIVNEYAKDYFIDKSKDYLCNSKICYYGVDNLVYKQLDKNDLILDIDNKIKNYNIIIDNHSNLEFYLYYIEKDKDINFNTNDKINIYEYISTNIDTKNTLKFEINNFEEFDNFFYKTDHHWNYNGSERAYEQLLSFLNVDTTLKEKRLICINNKFSGSKSRSSIFENILKENFCAYEYLFDENEIYINGKKGDYGRQSDYLKNRIAGEVTYGNFYGDDYGEIIFDTKNEELDNILIIGDSYDNAILKLISEKFNKTISIDLRNYKHYMKKNFDFDYYINEYNINKVLFIGSIDFYLLKDFMIGDSDNGI